jgi:hypothetical protein
MPITQMNTSRSTGERRQRIGSNRVEVNGLRKSEKAHLTEVVSPRRPTVKVLDSGPEFDHGLRPRIRCQASARDRDRRLSRRPRRSSDRWDDDRERCFGPAHCYGKLVNRWLHWEITNCGNAHKAALVKQRSHMRTARRAYARRAVINTIGTDSTPEQVDSGGSTSKLDGASGSSASAGTSGGVNFFAEGHPVSVKEIVSGHELGVARHDPRPHPVGAENHPSDGLADSLPFHG